MLAIALAVVITVMVVRPDSGGGDSPTPKNGASEFASADDDGPVNVITEDPTCAAWDKVSRGYEEKTKTVNWSDRDFSVPAAAWTPEQRNTFETVGDAMTGAANQAVNLAKQTPHRVMRNLYEQLIAYTKAFVQRIPSYTAQDDNLAVESDTLASALTNICAAITFGSAVAAGPLVAEPWPPSELGDTGDVQAPKVFLKDTNSICSEWRSLVTAFSDDTEVWRSIDPNISARQWTPEQKSVTDSVAPIMSANADELERLGRRSGNPVLEDFAVLAAQYRRAFVGVLLSFSPEDSYLAQAAAQLVRTVDWACKAAA